MYISLSRVAVAVASGAVLLLSVASSAYATMMATVTYTGEASYVFDLKGLFGNPSQDVFSASFTDIFKLDLSKGILNHYNFGGVPEEELIGGKLYAPETPVINSELTIDGHTVVFSGDTVGSEDNRQGIYVNSVAYNGAIGGQSGLETENYVTIETRAPLSLFSSYSGIAIPPNNFSSNFSICDLTAISPNVSFCLPAGNMLRGFLTPETVTVEVTNVVPEPDSWLLALCGLSGVGAILRSRNRSTIAS